MDNFDITTLRDDDFDTDPFDTQEIDNDEIDVVVYFWVGHRFIDELSKENINKKNLVLNFLSTFSKNVRTYIDCGELQFQFTPNQDRLDLLKKEIETFFANKELYGFKIKFF